MMKVLFFLSSVMMLTLASEEVVKNAIALLRGPGVVGNVTFSELPNGNLRIYGRVIGMPAGKYGFHVHESGDITKGCEGTKGHFNPNDNDHGHPIDGNRHVGDLPNLEFDSAKEANFDFEDHQIKLMGRHNIIGRAIVLDQEEDDYGKGTHAHSHIYGNSGARAACGVIGIM